MFQSIYNLKFGEWHAGRKAVAWFSDFSELQSGMARTGSNVTVTAGIAFQGERWALQRSAAHPKPSQSPWAPTSQQHWCL